MSKKSFFAAVMFIVLLSMSVHSAAGRDPYRYFFDQTWGNFAEELTHAKEAGKDAILIFFEMDECPFCYRMKNNVLNQQRVQDYFKKYFLCFAVDIEGDLEITDFNGKVMTQKNFSSKEHRVRATPVFQFFDLEGQKLVRYTGATSGIEEFILLGQFVTEKKYLEMPFTKYKRIKSGSDQLNKVSNDR